MLADLQIVSGSLYFCFRIDMLVETETNTRGYLNYFSLKSLAEEIFETIKISAIHRYKLQFKNSLHGCEWI